ncbi:MAG TPA: hypothetical protein VNE16_04880 [Vicinamibacterales bacterium]|nr:hypothetical protein [Vicinamibacterales bacterium]
MLKGSREAILRRIQPVSIHGQISLDVYFSDPEDPGGQVQVARVGEEAVARHLEPGDPILLEYLVGVVTAVRRR